MATRSLNMPYLRRRIMDKRGIVHMSEVRDVKVSTPKFQSRFRCQTFCSSRGQKFDFNSLSGGQIFGLGQLEGQNHDLCLGFEGLVSFNVTAGST